jgi:hypothetical protein
MDLGEDAKYRLSYLTLRLVLDAKLSTIDPASAPGLLQFLDLLAGTQLAGEAGGKHYASQRDKIESFIDAEFDEEILAIARKVAAELT